VSIASQGVHRGIFACLLLLLAPALAHALTFDDALSLAEERAPQIAARQRSIAAVRSARQAAGQLPDPKLVLGVENVPISGSMAYSLESDFMTMQKVGVMQDVPNGDRRAAISLRADADIARTEAELRIERLAVRRETALAWLALFYLQQKRALLDRLDQENQLFSDSVRAQLAAGRGGAADTVMPRQEAAMLADRRDELERDIAKARANLFRWVGEGALDPLAGEPPRLELTSDHLRHGVSEHPELAVFGPLQEAARAEVAMSQAEKKPGWAVEFDYQKRGAAFGDMVSLQFTFDLPLFAKSRQDPQIAAKTFELERISAERDAMVRQHAQELEDMLAERDTMARQIRRLDAEWLPLAQERVELSLAGYRSGREPLLGALEARKNLVETRMKRIDLESQRRAVDARLHFLNGEDRP
jgi:cobalt-zinc-cadmium efflux system outer membrane protein